MLPPPPPPFPALHSPGLRSRTAPSVALARIRFYAAWWYCVRAACSSDRIDAYFPRRPPQAERKERETTEQSLLELLEQTCLKVDAARHL